MTGFFPITEVFRQAVNVNPTKHAVIADGLTLSYSELYGRAASFAQSLRIGGFTVGERVTLYAANSADWIVAYYGALMAGAIINPVNLMLTPEEVEHVVRDCGTKTVVGSVDKLKPVSGLKNTGPVRELICFGTEIPDGMTAFNSLLKEDATGFAPHVAGADDLCAIAYTSGTTGHPKGAMHSHRAVAMNARLTAMMHGKSSSDVVVTALPLPHVYGTVVLNGTLACGGTLVVHGRFDAANVLASLQNHKATVFEGVPTMYFFLLNLPELADADLSSLRIGTVGGQSMSPAKMEQVEDKFGCPLIELWGMTELAGLGTTFAHCGPVQHGSIGVAFPYCQARVVDLEDANRALPSGEAGELMFKGPLVMQGYFGNDDATRETIEPDGWMHTGDVAKIDEHGFVYIVDRKKDLILTAGYNIYPAELERVIAGHPDVSMVAVGSVQDEEKGELAKAYVVLKDGAKPSPEDLIEFCRQHLSAYKVPRLVAFVDHLPTTSTGKVMRRALKTLDT